jgi:hypothetical protein
MMNGSRISLLGTLCLEALAAAFVHAFACIRERSCDVMMLYAVTIYGGPLRHKGIELDGGSDVVPSFQLSLGGRLH